MKRVFVVLLAFWIASSALALDTNYSPWSVSELPQVKATRTVITNGVDVVATVVHIAEDEREFRISVKGSMVYAVPVDIWVERTQTIIADLDGDGLEDVVKEVYHGSQGLCLGCDLMIFSQYVPGKFSVVTVPSERFTTDDICDLDNDGQKEIISCVLVGCEGHNYWVYRCWHVSDRELVSVDKRFGFPRAVWFTNKPNHKLVAHDLLTKIMANYPAITLRGKDSPKQPSQPIAGKPGSG